MHKKVKFSAPKLDIDLRGVIFAASGLSDRLLRNSNDFLRRIVEFHTFLFIQRLNSKTEKYFRVPTLTFR